MVVVAGVVLWYVLSRWEPGQSTWEHLPPNTVWAVEAHGVNDLLTHISRDEGIMSLIARAAVELDEKKAAFTGHGPKSFSEAVNTFSKMFGMFGRFYTIVAPNIGVIGVAGEGGDEFFAIVRPTHLMQKFAELPEADGSIVPLDTDAGLHLYMMRIDGWMAVAEDQDLLREIADNWNAKTKPLGPSPERRDAYIAFGFREWQAESIGGAAADEPEASSPLMLNDPFAQPGSGGDSSADDRYARVLLLVDDAGWHVGGEVAWGKRAFSGKSGFVGSGGDEIWSAPEPARADAADLTVAARAGRELYTSWKGIMEQSAGNAQSAESPPWNSLARLWITQAWLNNAAGDFLLLGTGPAAGMVDGVPPLPVFSLGWRIDPAVDQVKAKEDFAAALSLLLDSLTAPGGSALEQSVRTAITYESGRTGQGLEGVANIPPVMANSARPAWYLPDSAPVGWLASDPSGLPKATPDLTPERGMPPQPGDNTLHAAAAWNISNSFRDALFDVAQDRLETLPDSIVPWREKLLDNLDTINGALEIFPEGRARVSCDAEAKVVRFQLRIPHGRKVEIR